MNALLRHLLLLAVLAMLLVSHVRAEMELDEDIEDTLPEAEDEVAMDSEVRPPFISRAIFPNNTAPTVMPKFPAGSPSRTLIAYQNNDIGTNHQVVLVAGYLQPVGKYGTILQNFSVVRQGRTVKPSETTTFQYSFTPDASFEPGLYNLVVGLFYANTATNKTEFAAAFNATVFIDEPLGTDPRTFLTYLTLLAIFGGVAYYVADRFGIVKMIQASRRSAAKASSRPQRVEVGTRGNDYDPAYISPEHLRYREDLLRRGSGSPTNRRTSASPKKKN